MTHKKVKKIQKAKTKHYSEHPISTQLEQTTLNTLWIDEKYDQLEYILKLTKEKYSASRVELLGKLAFFQAKKKLSSNLPAFIGLVLTGGACLVLNHSVYHSEIEAEMQALGCEIKLLFSQILSKNTRKLPWNSTAINSYIDYEVSVLTHLLKLRVNQSDESIALIPSPSYFMTYAGSDVQLTQSFMPWLIEHSPTLVELYQANTHKAVLWVFFGEKISVIKDIMKLNPQMQFNPFLRLAISLRAEQIKPNSLQEAVRLDEFGEPACLEGVYQKIALNIAKSIINTTSSKNDLSRFWILLVEFYPVLTDPDIKQPLFAQIMQIFTQLVAEHNFTQAFVVNAMLDRLGEEKLVQELDKFFDRMDVCTSFLDSIAGEKKSKKLINAIKDEDNLRNHLTLLIDSSRYLVDMACLQDLYEHTHRLILKKKVNELLPLKTYFTSDFDPRCRDCYEKLFTHDFSFLVDKLKLPVMKVPEAPDMINPASKTVGYAPYLSILSQPNPFDVLQSDLTDSKPIIMQKVMKLIKERPNEMSGFRQAQGELFNPSRRILHHYLRTFQYDNPLPSVGDTMTEIPLRTG